MDTIQRLLLDFEHLYNNYAETNGMTSLCSCVLTEVKKSEESSGGIKSSFYWTIGPSFFLLAVLVVVVVVWFFKYKWRSEPNECQTNLNRDKGAQPMNTVLYINQGTNHAD